MIKNLQFLFLATLTLFVADIYGQTDSSDTDLTTQVNEIKLDDSFIYGEATMESLEEANALAQDFLKINIEQWVSEENEGESVSKIDIGEIQRKCQRLELIRGTMFRSFAYINKDNIMVTKGDLSLTIQIDTIKESVVVAEPVQVADTLVAEVVVAPTVETVETAAPVVATPTPVAVAAPVVAPAPVADTVYIEVPVVAPAPVADTVYIEVPVVAPAPVADTVYIEVPVAASIEVATVEEEVITSSPEEAFEKDLTDVDNIGELLALFDKAEYEMCKYGDVTKSSIKKIDINSAYLVIYTPADGNVQSILGQRLNIGVRLNLKTGKVDSTLNYKGSNATWVIFNEK